MRTHFCYAKYLLSWTPSANAKSTPFGVLCVGGGSGIRTHVPVGKRFSRLFTVMVSLGYFIATWFISVPFEILIPQGFLPRFKPFELKSNEFKSNGISKTLSKISHFGERFERKTKLKNISGITFDVLYWREFSQ